MSTTTANGNGHPRPRVFGNFGDAMDEARRASAEEADRAAARPKRQPDGGLVFKPVENFAEDWDAPLVLPSEIAREALYDGLLHWVSGHFGSGKSTLVADWAHLAMAEGRHVVWLDWELSPSQARARFKAVGIPKPLARQYLHYVSGPTLPPNDQAVAMLYNLLTDLVGGEDELRRAVVVKDSFTKAFQRAMPGTGENDNSAVSEWQDKVLISLKRWGATPVVIDHPPKDSKATNAYVGRGAGSKADDADLAYTVVAEQKFTRDRPGTVRVVCHKDRESVLPANSTWLPSKYTDLGEQWYTVGDGQGGLPVVPTEPQEPHTAAEELPRAERMLVGICGAMRVSQELTTRQLAQAAAADPQETSLKDALRLALKRDLLKRARRGVYAAGGNLAELEPET